MCNIFENSISNNFKHHKIDKKQLAKKILEIQQVKDQINFLYNNNKIKKVYF